METFTETNVLPSSPHAFENRQQQQQQQTMSLASSSSMASTSSAPIPPVDEQQTIHDADTWLSRCLGWMFPDTPIQQWRDIVDKFNISNLLFCYCLPFFYVFYPTWLMPAIFLKSLSFVVGCLYRLISRHHGHYNSTQTTANVLATNGGGGSGTATPTNTGGGPSIKSTRYRPSSPSPGIGAAPSSSSSLMDDERNHLYFWLQRCSICLEQTYSLCLESCRDQFCKDCFVRYTEETVQASWGLGVTRIKCPVCQEVIPQSEWSRYVSKKVVDKYNEFNQPYRPFVRHCSACENQVIPCQSPRQQGTSRERRLEMITEALTSLMSSTENTEWQEQLSQIQHFFEQTCQQKGATFRIGRVQDLYQKMVPPLAQMAQQQQQQQQQQQHPLATTTTITSPGSSVSLIYEKASHVSKQLVAMEVIPEAWKQTQFWHVAHFPLETCECCGLQICLQCGEKAHIGMTCVNYLKSTLDQQPSSEQTASVQWKINNTRPCPNCSVMINRSEGCNRVDCLLCGHRFCWHCLSSWTQRKCGFYQCGQQVATMLDDNNNNNNNNNDDEDEDEAQTQNGKAELGVPNMTLVDSRRRS